MKKEKTFDATLIRKRKKQKENLLNTSYAMGPVIGWLIFGAIPLVVSLYLSFTELHINDITSAGWVGLKNYIQLLSRGDDGYLKNVLCALASTACCFIATPISIVLSVFLAQLLSKIKFMQRLFRTAFFVPYVCSASVIVVIFRMIFDSGSGAFNQILQALGLRQIEWLTSSPFMFFLSITIQSVWSGLANNTLLCLAAVSRVDESYYEAARIDGAGEFRQFFQITLPAITPTLSYIVTFSLIGAFQTMGPYLMAEGVYGCPYWMQGAGSGTGVWVTVGYYIYIMISKYPSEYGIGMASSVGWILGIVIFLITLINLRLQKRWVNYDF